MKNISSFLFIFILSAAAFPMLLAAQADFYGDYEFSAAAVLNEDDYESLLNPGNIAGLNDITLAHSLTLKLSAGDDAGSFELWAGLDQQLDPYTGEQSDVLNSLELQRASVSWNIGDMFIIKLGRISMLTGYGYGWNPIDFANPLKNPADPDAELTGVDSLLLHLFPYESVNLKLYAVLDSGSSGLAYEEVQGGAELSAYLPIGELKLTGLYDYDETEGEDARVSAAGAGLYLDIAEVGIYGEGAVLNGSRTLFVSDDGIARKTELLFNALGGLEYTFPFGLTAVAEYFYNGEGYDKDEMAAYAEAIDSSALTMLTDDTFALLSAEYRQGCYSKHYALLNLLYPVYEINTDLSITAMYSADTGVLAVFPLISLAASGGLSIEAGYSGIFDFYDYTGSEADLSPAAHAVTLSGNFSF